MNIKLIIASTFLVLGLSAKPASAAVDCTGTVTNLSLQLSLYGTVTLSLSGGPQTTYLCNVDGNLGDPNSNGVPPGVCKTMFSVLMAARLSGKKVTIRFYDHDSCAAVPGWASAGTLGWTVLLHD